MPPFRLYIVVSLLFFLVVLLTASQVSTNTAISSIAPRKVGSEASADMQRELDESTDPEERAALRSQLQRLNDKLAPTAEAASCNERIHVAAVSSWLQRGLVHENADRS